MAIRNPIINEAEGQLSGRTGDTMVNPLASIIARLWETVTILGGLLVLIFLVWGAFDWLSSGGSEKKLEGAKTKITNAVIGMIILAGSFAIVNLVEYFTGFSIIEIVWPTPPTN